MWLLCLTRAVLFRCATQHSGLKATVRLYKADSCAAGESCFAWGPPLYQMQILESLVSGNNPAFKAASWGKNGGKRGPCLFSTPCANRGKKKIYCPLQHPLKGWIGPSAGAVNHLWGLLLPNLETLGNLYNLTSLTFGSPRTSPPVRPSVCSTCGPRREVLQRRSLHHSVGVSHHKHFVEHSIVVDEALDHTGRLDVLQVLFTEDDGHLRDTRSRRDLLIKRCHCSHKRAVLHWSGCSGMETD